MLSKLSFKNECSILLNIVLPVTFRMTHIAACIMFGETILPVYKVFLSYTELVRRRLR